MKHKFTRVELLLIVGILSLAASFLLPVASRAAAQSQTTLCLNQLNRLNAGLNAYADANDDYFPTSSPANYQAEWASLVAPYVGVKTETSAPADAFVCPADARFRSLTYGDLLAKKSSYGINGYGVCWNNQNGQGVRRAHVRNPDMLLLADADGWIVVGYAGEGPARVPKARHEEGKAVNILHFDGTAETKMVNAEKPEDMYKEGNLPTHPFWSRNMR